MVGWSRRGRESRERYRRHMAWWATLTPEAKDAYRAKEEVDRKRTLRVLEIVMLIAVLLGMGALLQAEFGANGRGPVPSDPG